MKNRRSLPSRLIFVGGMAASILALTATTASATTFYGGDVVGPNCTDAFVISQGSSSNYAIGAVEGDSGCQVLLEQRNTATAPNGPYRDTAWAYGSTTSLYHNDGVHQLRVWVFDPYTGVEAHGAWVN